MATANISLDENYVEVLNGPGFVSRFSGTVRLHIGPTAPSTDTEDFHSLSRGAGSVTYTGTEKVFCRAQKSAASVVVTPTI